MARRLRIGLFLAVVLAVGLPWPAPAQEDAVGRAQALIVAGERAQARALLDSLLTSPGGVDGGGRARAEYLRALLEEDGGPYERRLRALLEATPSSDRLGLIHLALGRLAFVRGELQIALAAFRRAAEAGRGEEGSLWEGLTAFALGDPDAARTALERAADSADRAIRQRARLALGDTFRAGGNWEDAARHYRALREEARPGPGWWTSAAFHEARCREEMGDREEARRLLESLLADAPHAYEAPLAMARLKDLRSEDPRETVEGDQESGAHDAAASAKTGFSVQVGAFGVQENAAKLAEEVRARGFEEVRVRRGEDRLHRVLVGRVTDRRAAESLGDSLGSALGLSFSVVRND